MKSGSVLVPLLLCLSLDEASLFVALPLSLNFSLFFDCESSFTGGDDADLIEFDWRLAK